MKIFLYGINFSPELTGIGKYSGEMCDWFSANNNTVQVVTAPPYYPEWAVKETYSQYKFMTEQFNGIDVLRCPLYVPRNPRTLTRLLHLMSFAFTSGLALLFFLKKKPNIVLMVQPTLFCAPGALLYSKFTGAKCVIHVQDYEVDALFGLGMIKKNLLLQLAEKIESWIMSKFDAVSTISYSMMERAIKKGVDRDKLIFFPNWSDTDFVNPSVSGHALRQEWGLSETDKVILYAGNMGKKQGLELVIEAAKKFASQSEVKFFMVGAGAHIGELKKLALGEGLANVFFRPLLPWRKVPEMLAMADIHLVIQKKGVADVVLPSKLTNILSAGGHALVTAEVHTELGVLVEKHPGIYTRVEPEDLSAFTEGLESLLLRDTQQTNTVARKYAEAHLNKDKVLKQFEQNLLRLCS